MKLTFKITITKNDKGLYQVKTFTFSGEEVVSVETSKWLKAWGGVTKKARALNAAIEKNF